MDHLTPKALANFSPRLERQRQPWGRSIKQNQTLKGFRGLANPFRVDAEIKLAIPGFSFLEPFYEAGSCQEEFEI